MTHRAHQLAFLSLGLLSSACLAQSAVMTVSHNDLDGIILPGQTIHVTLRISWLPAGTQLAGFVGELRTEPVGLGGQGTIANRSSTWSQPSALIHLGSTSGDDIVGIDVASIPAFFTPMVLPPWGTHTGFNAFEHDWTAPATPGLYAMSFVPAPLRPNVLIYPSSISPNFAEAATTYVGTSITVTPAPATLALLAAVPFAIRRCREV